MISMTNSIFHNIPRVAFGPSIMRYESPRWLKFFHIPYISQKVEQYYYYPKCKKEWGSAIVHALKVGFRILDYSVTYGNSQGFGQSIQCSGVPRTELFITTRVSNIAQRSHHVREEFFQFLREAKLDYVDLLQFHWPVTDCYLDTWREMEKLHEEGYVRYLGVANCHQHHFEKILSICRYKPQVAQFELHPLFTQTSLVDYYNSQGVEIEAYTSLARRDPRLYNLPLMKVMAEKYGKSISQIVLRWHIQRGQIPIFSSMNHMHIQDNFNIFDFVLSDEDMRKIESVNINSRLRYDPDNCDFSIL